VSGTAVQAPNQQPDPPSRRAGWGRREDRAPGRPGPGWVGLMLLPIAHDNSTFACLLFVCWVLSMSGFGHVMVREPQAAVEFPWVTRAS
jgi:hypothetical protein